MLTMNYAQVGQLVRIMLILKRMGIIKSLEGMCHGPLNFPDTGNMAQVWLKVKK